MRKATEITLGFLLCFLLLSACQGQREEKQSLVASKSLLPHGHTDAELAGLSGVKQAELPGWKFVSFSDVPGAPEPSGLCYIAETSTFYLVDDGDYMTRRPSAVLKLDAKGTVLQHVELGKDLEGVCWCPDLQSVMVADESNETVYLLDPDDLTVKSSFEVKDKIDGKKAFQKGGNGFEGIEYLSAGLSDGSGKILLLNQDDPTSLLILPVDRIDPSKKDQKLEARRQIELDQINAGEVRYCPQTKELWVVHSWMNITEILDPRTMMVKRWEVMPGCAQEGVAFDGAGRMWVGQDTGGIAIYDPLPASK